MIYTFYSAIFRSSRFCTPCTATFPAISAFSAGDEIPFLHAHGRDAPRLHLRKALHTARGLHRLRHPRAIRASVCHRECHAAPRQETAAERILQVVVCKTHYSHDCLLRPSTKHGTPMYGNYHTFSRDGIAVLGVAAALGLENPTVLSGDCRHLLSRTVLHTATCMREVCSRSGSVSSSR